MNARARNTLFQLVMCLASFYLTMLLTNWATYDASKAPGVGTASMWIQFVSHVSCRSWSASRGTVPLSLAPMCCPNRTFE